MTETSADSPDSGPRVTREQMRDISTLRRASDHRMVAGVSEGLSRHFDVDPLLIRVVFGAMTLFGGAGVALYVLAWITIPEEGQDDSIMSRSLRRDPTRVMVGGLSIAAVIAAIAMIGAIGFSAPNPFPIVVVSILAIGAFAIFSRRAERQQASTPPYPTPYPPPESFQAAGSSPEVESPSGPDDPTTVQPRAWWQRDNDAAGGGGGPVPSAPYLPPPPPPLRRPRSHLFAITMAVVAIALGSLWILNETVYDDLPPSVFPGVSLAVIAAALVVGTWYGRSRLLIAAGILATLATVGSLVVGPGPYGERIYRPSSAAAVDNSYDHGVGRMVVHLENIADPENLDGRTIDLEARIGQVAVVVPSSITVAIDAEVTHGEISGPPDSLVENREQGGQAVTMTSAGVGPPDLTIIIDLRYGEIVITQFDCPVTPRTVPSAGLDTDRTTEGARYATACN